MGDRQGRFILVGEKCEQLLKKMAVADASGSLNTGKWRTGTFAALGEPVPIFFVKIDCVRKMRDRHIRYAQ